jgi:SAM-dependent methyltransferase
VPPDLARAALAAVPFPPTGCTFLDLGCGKGRALLLAAERPFARVLGVERSPSLVRRCRRNIASARRADLTALDPEVIEGDVWDVPLPCGDLVLFLYNPFGAELVGDVLRRARSVDRRNLALVYVNPQEEDTVIAIGWRRAAAGGSDSGTERWAVYLPVS